MVLADKEVMSTLFSELNNAMDALNDIILEGKDEFMANRHLRGSAKYHLLVAIESVLDLSNHLITQNKWRLPEDYADTFLVMAENEILKRDEAEHLGEMARFRNRLVHQYWRIDDSIIWDILVNDRMDIADYAEKILNLLKS
ncbi:DUF86 domain-containing protein [Methanospirillum hungatei]|uniref:type VII toxin-antitoxin system HepT family RNase toxin n=1 Tax=Methanospirillum hungatei TaxID=2203 RepID=UPI0026EBC464|nr:DUF86 domain-containing protein [Methanospirillum hungatei]MCA1914965.1 DUF86 domain-containing protein [Methanospirillum hungatei]